MAAQLLKRFPLTSQARKSSSVFCYSSSPSSSDEAPTTAVTTAVSILTHRRSKSRWSYLRSLYPDGFDPDDFSQITLHLRNRPHLAYQFFRFSKSLCNHNLASYSTIIHILARGRLKSHAQDIIRMAIRASELREDDDGNNPRSTSLKVFENLVKTYKDCGSAPFVFDLLIKACLGSKNIDPSIEIMRLLRSRGISLNVSTLNSLIYCVCQSRGVEAGYEIYREVFRLDEQSEKDLKRDIRVTPNVYTYHTLMLCCYRNGLIEKVKKIWDEMVELNCVPNAYSYTVLMAVFCGEGKMEEAEKLWQEMRTKALEPDAVSYETMIGGFCKTGNVGRAEEFYREMAMNGIEGTSATYEHIIKGHCDIGDIDSAILVYKDMCRKAFKPEALTLDLMIRLLCDKGRVDEALEFLRYAMDKFDLFPKETSYEAMIKRLCYEGRMEEALKLQAEMIGKGFQLDSEIYGAFIDGYMRQGNEEMAGALRKEMLQIQMRS
ncbi:pentatricopeptide repeat-containing protein At2g15980 [Neltuma alba]|uniref:pentatricopeptide repeat-containing protein At2g15980 n=1 Tax=Neltuma alba TaxID=207710 RepID=UPI0010A2F230|nr:pentatricopeptide repeat-containing protein At2g15980-like [Prosopis alba]